MIDWFILALIAPAIWAVTNLIDDNLIRGVYRSPMFGTIISGLIATFPVLLLLFIEVEMPTVDVALIAILAGFILVSSYFLYFKSLLRASPSIVISLWNLTPAIIPFLAFFFLGEVLSLNQYLGFSVILFASLGISIIDIKGFKFSNALYLMIFASILTAIESILLKFVFNSTSFFSGYIFMSVGMGLAALFFMVVLKEGRMFFGELIKVRKYLGLFFIVEVLNIIAVFVSALALSRGPVSLVSVVGGVQPIYVLLFSFALFPFFPKFFREATHGNVLKKLIFMVIMIMGLFIITL